jgi:hypothetical protein
MCDKLKDPKIMLAVLVVLFIGLFFLFNAKILSKSLTWGALVLCAFGFLALQYFVHRPDKEQLVNALYVGLFLMLFDFVVENSGTIFGLWRSNGGMVTVLTVPIEVMLVCLVGGMAWALYLPKKFSLVFSAADLLVFSFFGALGEWVLMQNGMMTYYLWWTSFHAFIAYALTWFLLHAFRYMVVPEEATGERYTLTIAPGMSKPAKRRAKKAKK